MTQYRIRVFLEGMPGYFTYTVEGKTRAMVHMAEIQRSGYRRYDEESERFTWYSPRRIWEINVIGPGLESDYPDEFKRT